MLLFENSRRFVAYMRSEDRRSSKSASATRVQDARAAEIAMRVADRQKVHLAEAQAEALNVIDEFAGQLRSDILAIPAQVTTDLTLRRKIEDRAEKAFGAAADRAGKAADRIDAAARKPAKSKTKRAA